MNYFDPENEDWTVTLTLDDDVTIECRAIAVFTASNGEDYIDLLPLEGPDAGGEDVYLYRYAEDADGEPSLENIEDDDEYEIASDAYDEYLDDREYERLFAEEDRD